MNAATTRPQSSVIQSVGSGMSAVENRNRAPACQPASADRKAERSSGTTAADKTSMAPFRADTSPSSDPVAFLPASGAGVAYVTFESLAKFPSGAGPAMSSVSIRYSAPSGRSAISPNEYEGETADGNWEVEAVGAGVSAAGIRSTT